MKVIKPYVELFDPINGEEILRKIEHCGRTCYKSEEQISKDSAKRFINGLLKSKHLSVIEHVSLTVKIICSRSISHEIVRHRLASYSQESTRYCDFSKEKFGKQITVILPKGFDEDLLGEHNHNHIRLTDSTHERLKNTEQLYWFYGCADTEIAYLRMLSNGAKPEIAREILPHCLKTEIVMTCNLREWKHIFQMRCQKAAHPHIQETMKDVLHRFYEEIPIIFDDEAKEFLDVKKEDHAIPSIRPWGADWLSRLKEREEENRPIWDENWFNRQRRNLL